MCADKKKDTGVKIQFLQALWLWIYQKKKSKKWGFYLPRVQTGGKQSPELHTPPPFQPSAFALYAAAARGELRDNEHFEMRKQPAAGELKQEGPNKQRPECQRKPSVDASDSSCDLVCPAVTTLTATMMTTTHHCDTAPSTPREAIKICAASAQSEGPFHFTFTANSEAEQIALPP